MPSARKHRRKKMQQIPRDRKQLRRKEKKQKSTNIACKEIRNSWDASKTLQQNMKEMGLAFNANKALPIPRKLPLPKIIQNCDLETKSAVKKPEVLKAMEMEVELGEKEKQLRLPSDDVQFCTYMLDKYKENYKGMCRDRKNVFQLTPKQIRDKIRTFKRCKGQYKLYLDSKQAAHTDVEMKT
uniref:Nucleolar protein 16 n=1 Tax=Phallusia mammillata TaxID=59560 RepID=A0A6F9DN50_9ASCI|nr:nucleolar protein 16 [Phallusia mammillata]